MRIFLTVLFLLVAPISNAAQVLFPYEPIGEWGSFYVKADAQVQLCIVGSAVCGRPLKVLKSTTGNITNNCGQTFKEADLRPAGSAGMALECRPYFPPEVPTTPLPDGWIKMVDYCQPDANGPGCTFDVGSRHEVKMCDETFTKCSNSYIYLKSDNHWLCIKQAFPNFPADAIPRMCIGKRAPVTYRDRKRPALTIKLFDHFERGDVPASVDSAFQRYVVWLDSDNKYDGFLYQEDEEKKDEFLVSLRSDEAMNAYGRTQPLSELTLKENTFLTEKKLAFKNKLEPPPPAYFVAYIANNATRPYYLANAAKTGIGPKKGDVKHTDSVTGKPLVECDCLANRLGTTNYCKLPALSVSLKVDVFAICSIRQ